MTIASEFFETWPSRITRARRDLPQVAKGFGTLYQATMTAGATTVLEKELIAVGIAIALRCDSCAYAHIENALKAGATRAQLLETAGVAVMMQGGPAYTYLPKLLEALDTLIPPVDDGATTAADEPHAKGG